MAKKYSRCLELVVLPLWIVSLFAFGLIFFTRGFLLVRIEIGNHSKVAEFNNDKVSPNSTRSSDKTWITFNKTLLFLIDGLRYDFMLYNGNITHAKAKHYQNKLVNLNKIVDNQPENAKIFKFVADPPTITVQRVKGLTTGSLPTFADATSNFGSAKIPEDNLIHQLSKHNKSVVFIGDEIWLDLYPNYFKRQYPYPSLDALDLDGADDGIKQHLIPEMKKNDWSVIIAHGLGVDHCGHSYGPDHPEMERKLKEMDTLLKEAIDNLDNDTILYVFGDHGMTQGGDHGGESEEETVAGLMVYSKRKIFPKDINAAKDKVIAQVDLVPTISLQMGIPIPFSNIGTVIEDLFMLEDSENNDQEKGKYDEDAKRNMNKVLALRENAQQVMRYLEEYSKVSQDIGEETFLRLRGIYINAEQAFKRLHFGSVTTETTLHSENLSVMRNAQVFYREFVHQVLATCREIWAKFDLLSTGLGLILMLLTSLSGVVIVWSIVNRAGNDIHNSFTFIQYVGILLNIAAWFLNVLLSISVITTTLLVTLQVISLVCLTYRFIPMNKTLSENGKHFVNGKLNGISVVLFIIYLCGLSSNNFIENEDLALLVLIQVMLISRLCIHVRNSMDNKTNEGLKHYERINSKKRHKKKDQGWKLDWQYIFRAVLILIASICAKVAMNFWKCREEQINCTPSSFLQPLKTLMYQDHFMFKIRLYLAIASVLGLIFSCYCWCRKNGHLVGNSLVYLCTQVCLPICGFSILLHWALQSAYEKKLAAIFDLPWLQQVVFPRVVYDTVSLILVFLIWDPLGICLIMKHRRPWHERVSPGNNLNENIHAVFRNMRNSMNEKIQSENQEESPPLVYGLGTVYTTAYYTLVVASALVFMMLLNDGIALSVLLLCIAAFCLLVDESFGDSAPDKIATGPSLSSLITWSLMSSYWFYGTGHQATIPAIRFDAAFIGRQGDSGARFIPGLLIFLNTYASQILCSLALPLICIWSISKHGSASNWIPPSKNSPVTKNEVGEMILRENSKDTRRVLLGTILAFITMKMLKVGAISAVVTLHRRHLLIWSAFAPRFVFEAAGFLFSASFLFASVLFFIRVDSALEKWTIRLEEMSKEA